MVTSAEIKVGKFMQKLLIIMDPKSKDQVALSRGLEVARATGTEIEAVAFTHEYLNFISADSNMRTEAKEALITHRQKWLERIIALADCTGVKIHAHTVWNKYIHEWIIHRCHTYTYQAVIKTGNRSETFFYTPTDWHLLRDCPAPVMLVSENKWNKAHPILAAVDLSSSKPRKQALNLKVLQQASALAKAMNTELHLVHAIHTSVLLADLEIIDPVAQTRNREEALKPQIETLKKAWNLTDAQIHLRAGPAQKVIPSVANKIKADMVVMGTTAKSGIRAYVIGNTAEKVLSHLRTDVLALKPDN